MQWTFDAIVVPIEIDVAKAKATPMPKDHDKLETYETPLGVRPQLTL